MRRPIASLRLVITSLLCVILGSFVGCGRSGGSIDQDVQEPLPVMVVTVSRAIIGPVRQQVQLFGVTAASRHITLRAPTSGLVTGFELQGGDTVRRGQIVAHVVSREDMAAQAGLAVARQLDPPSAAQLAGAMRHFTRAAGVPVAAPEYAIVEKRLVSSGQIVADLDPLADLIDPNSTYVEATVPLANAYRLRPGLPALVTSPIQPGTAFPARVAAFLPSSNLNSATLSVRVEFNGKPPILPIGIAVEVRVTTVYVPRALVVPKAALFENAENASYYVFAVGADSVAHRTSVTPGIRNSDMVQIAAGLKPGAIVITSGGYALSDGLRVKTVSANSLAVSTLGPK